MFANRVSPEEKKEVQSVKLSSLASSSEGNCIYVGTKKTNVLVDCGVSAKRIENSLSELDLTVPEFDGILITHEHTDHIKGLRIKFITTWINPSPSSTNSIIIICIKIIL